jgi:hypothetical protein
MRVRQASGPIGSAAVPETDASIAAVPSTASAAETRLSFGLLVALLAGLTALRLAGLWISTVDLFYDEAQYWNWAQDLAFGYYSKPPLLAWILAGTRHVCGDSEFCTRAPAPLMYFVTSLLVYAATLRLYDRRTAFWAGLLTALTTGVVFSARVIATDVPLLMFWALALVAYTRLLSRRTPGWGLVLGLALGLGLLAKYAMAYFLAGMLLSAMASPAARAVLRSRAFLLALAVATVLILPNLVWNATHKYVTLWHTSDLVLGEEFRISLRRLGEFVGSQFGVFGPVVFAVMIIATFRLRSDRLTETDRIMVAFFVTPVAFVALIATFVHAYANWASVAAISGLILTAALIVRERRMGWLYGSIAIGLVMQGTLLLGDAVAVRIPASFAGFTNPYRRTLGWHAYADRVAEVAGEIKPAAIANDNRGDIAALRYYLRDRPFRILSWGTSDNPYFDSVHPLTDDAGEPVLFITSCRDVERLAPFYANVKPLGEFRATYGVSGTHAFAAFLLAQRRAPIGILQECRD